MFSQDGLSVSTSASFVPNDFWPHRENGTITIKQERCWMNYMVYLALKGSRSEVNFHPDDQLLSKWLTITRKKACYLKPQMFKALLYTRHLLHTAPLILSSSSFFLSFIPISSTLLWIAKTEVYFAASAVCSVNTAAHPKLFIQRILSFFSFSLRLSSM